jgi:hypothetical protein
MNLQATRVKVLELEAELQRVMLQTKIRAGLETRHSAWLLPALGAAIRLATGRAGFWRIAAAYMASRYLANKHRRAAQRS